MSRKGASAPRIVHAGGHEGTGDFPDHRHEGVWELIYLRDGKVTERSGPHCIEMLPGMFLVHPPGVVHGDSASSKYFLFHVQVTSDQPLAWPRSGHDLEGAPIQAVLDMVVQEWYHDRPHREAFIRHCALLLDILMKRCSVQAEESYTAPRVVAAVRGLFRREFRTPIDLNAVAADLRISKSTLYAYFHQVLGRTPHEVLDGIRLKHALYLLKHSKLPIEEIAKSSGYCSSSHLGRKLRRAYGLTATEVREKP